MTFQFNRKERTMAIAIGINLFVILLKFVLAGLSDSLALSASAWHSFADIFVNVFVLAGLVVSRVEAASAQRSGRLSLIENGVALVVAGFIIAMGLNIFGQVAGHPAHPLMNLGPVTLFSLLTIVAALVVSRLLLYVGRQEDSPSLIASGYHAQMELWSSLVVVLGLAGSALGIQSLDRAAAVLVVVFVAFAGYDIGSSALAALRARGLIQLGHAHQHRSVWRAFLPTAIVTLVAFYLASGFYTVQPDERAVVRRFGQVLPGELGPGLHYRLPWPVDQADIVSVAAVRRAETDRALMLTGDENLINVRLGVHYVVADPVAYLFRVSNPDTLVAAAAEAAVRQVIAEEAVDNVLTVDKALIQSRAAALAQPTLDAYQTGLQIVDVQLLESSPPEAAADAFREVASAREDKQTVVNEALAYQNEIIPTARGDAATTVNAAKAYAAEKVNAATGEAARFTAQQTAHADMPAITHIRLYLEAVENVLPGVRKVLVDPSVTLQTTDLWFAGDSTVTAFPPRP
ncbi:MAG TPA: FtsH protease activity modulator HflK [Anaerolineae bacterium]|nr:FtsH protease activity modulator HflK [Anaerolineae bacterium]